MIVNKILASKASMAIMRVTWRLVEQPQVFARPVWWNW
jgi:hypothetical protein